MSFDIARVLGAKKKRIKPHSVRLDPLGVSAQRKSRAVLRTSTAFLFPSLRLASGRRSENKKAGYFVPGFFFVAEGGFEPPTFGL